MPNIKAKQLAPPAPASPALNLAQAVQIGKLSWVNTPSVVGTYADSATPDVKFHYVLEPNGVCTVYNQFGTVREGNVAPGRRRCHHIPPRHDLPIPPACFGSPTG